MESYEMPPWSKDIMEIFRSTTIDQFIIYGNTDDFVPLKKGKSTRFYSLKEFLIQVLFEPIDIVIYYDRGKGIRIPKGSEHFFQYLQVFDKFHRTAFSSDSGIIGEDDLKKTLEHPGMLPRSPGQALELIDRFIRNLALRHSHFKEDADKAPPSLAVVIDYAQFIVPKAESMVLSSEASANLIKLMDWAKDPAILNSPIVTVLISEALNDLNALIIEYPFNAKINIPLPDSDNILDYVSELVRTEKEFSTLCEVSVPVLAQKLLGLNRVNIRNVILRAVRNSQLISMNYLTRVKKELIEKEAFERLEFIQSDRSLDDVAGHEEARKWLREDARLLKKNATRAIPMGYLVVGRIGTGKTFLIECFSGECGVPFVVLKNFREKWVGATEGNLEKIFSILHALGQVVVFIDEADQFAGRRDSGGSGDSGVSSRIYGMLAKEMSDTKNRGKILWIFATSRPDLLEVDLKRQGRLDVHIPLFPPEKPEEQRDLFFAMAKKLKLNLTRDDLPDLPFEGPVSGNELEGILVRAVRRYELAEEEDRKPMPEVLSGLVKEFRPLAHTLKLDLMDLLAVKECTDERFLPPRFKDLQTDEIDRKITEILHKMSEQKSL